MRNTYNNNATDKEQKITAGPEWVVEDTTAMWKRIDDMLKRTKVSVTKVGEKCGFSPSTVYNTISAVKKGQSPRDTELRIIEALANEMNVPLNYLVHGEMIDTEKDGKKIDNSLVDNIFSLGNGNRLALFLMTIPYMSTAELDAVREDILTRFN